VKFEAEVVADELLPAVRSILTSKLHGEYGLKQNEIARCMEITQPAVSQYINGQRAHSDVIEKLEEDPQVMVVAEDAAESLAKGEEAYEEVSEIVKTVRDKGLIKERFENSRRL